MTDEELAGLSAEDLAVALQPAADRLAADVQMVCLGHPRVSVAVALTAVLGDMLAGVSAADREATIEHVGQSIRRRAVVRGEAGG